MCLTLIALKTYLKQETSSQVYMKDHPTLFPIPEYIEDNFFEKNQDNTNYKGKPRLNTPVRNQVEFKNTTLDDLISDDHKVRFIWDYVSTLDLSKILNKINSVEGVVGRNTTDPRILLTLWIFAISEGIGSAREIERLCSEHNAYMWICGGVDVNYHTISDFRTDHGRELEDLLIQTVAILIKGGCVNLNRISQDGIRIRANAGSDSFRRKETLKERLKLAKAHLEEVTKNSNQNLNQKQAAKKRAGEERVKKIEEAMRELNTLQAQKEGVKKKYRKKLSEECKKKLRSSTTDPQARKMKMRNGGFDPAYNAQIAVDTKTQIIVGIYATNIGSDTKDLAKMFKKIKKTYKKTPKEWLADPGYINYKQIEELDRDNCKMYIALKSTTIENNSNQAINRWQKRMKSEEGKSIYKERAATSECVNAIQRNRGLQQFLVRGKKKIQSVLMLFGITHNMLRTRSLIAIA